MTSKHGFFILFFLLSCGRQEQRPTAQPPKILTSEGSEDAKAPPLQLTSNASGQSGSYTLNEASGYVEPGKYLQKNFKFSLRSPSLVKISSFQTNEKCRLKGITQPEFFIYELNGVSEAVQFGEIKSLPGGNYILRVRNKNNLACVKMSVHFSMVTTPVM